MEFSRQEYQTGLSFPSPGDLPDPGIELGSLTLQADYLLSEPPGIDNHPNPASACSEKKLFFFSLCGMPHFKENITHEQDRYSAGIEQVWGRLESVCKAVLVPGGY